MNYPQFDLPMYKPLSDLSKEYFLPNINLIEQNSITLLETNQKFIESYMVGINHEMSRELLWREYPTDQRGSYFRQFWDVSGYLPDASENLATLKERLKDIPELHRWVLTSNLGDHDNRASWWAKSGACPRDSWRAAEEISDGGHLRAQSQMADERSEKIDSDSTTRSCRHSRRPGGQAASHDRQNTALQRESRSRYLLLRLRPERRGSQRQRRNASR